jgi:hypothetical protein
MRTENGIAVPSEQSPLTWAYIECDSLNEIVDDNGQQVIGHVHNAYDADFLVVAANYHERMADLVRRLAEWNPTDETDPDILLHLCNDAAALWAEYQKEVQP